MSKVDVHIVDYGLGNLGSIVNMFRRIGANAKLVEHPDDLLCAERILLPGVGAFDTGMRCLRERNFIEVLRQKVKVQKTPVLGICLGMQLMSEASEEGDEPGLGWIQAKTVDIKRHSDPALKIKFPHVGWNYIDPIRSHFLLSDFPDDPRFYFVHRYMVLCENQDNILALTRYGDIDVTAMVVSGNIIGAQFHPEKSHKFGMQLLRNFSIWMPNHGR